MSRLLVLQFSAFSGLFLKKAFLLSFLAKNYYPVVIIASEAGFSLPCVLITLSITKGASTCPPFIYTVVYIWRCIEP